MPKETNLNVSPYFDDFDPDSKYYKVLVKPEFPVQAREINNLQSILQNQIESLGNHFFKEGAKVIPGQTSYNRYYNAVQIDNTFSGVDLEVYLSSLVGKILIGETSGVEAVVDNFITAAQSERDSVTLYVNYLVASPNDNEQIRFSDGENLLVAESLVSSSIAFEAGQAVAKTISQNCNSFSSTFTVSEGVYYLRGHFVTVDTQTIILDQYTNTPTYKIGFTVNEEIITADIDPNLTDNARGFNNYSAPGADRFKITAILDKKEINDQLTENFVEISQIQEGIIRNTPNDPLYNIIEDKFAKRTFEESGDYYVRRFDVSCVDSLNNNIGNNGIYQEGSTTYQGNTPSDDLAIYKVSPGKAYVRGYEVEINAPTFLDVEKPRTTKTIGNQSLVYSTGATLSLNRVYGTPEIGIGNTFVLSLRDSRIGASDSAAAGDEIGVARVYDFALEEGSYQTNLDVNKWDITLYDIQPYTRITLNQPITLSTPAYFVGNSSGATGHLKSSVTNSTSIVLYNVTGKFINNESFTINNVTNSRIGVAVTTHDISNVKSVYATSTYGTFNADVIQSPSTFVGIASVTAAVGNAASVIINGLGYANNFKAKDVVSFSVPTQTTLPILASINSVSTNNQSTVLAVTGVTGVDGVCSGTLPTSATQLTDLTLLKTNLFGDGQTRLYTPLPRQNVQSVDLSEANIVIRKQYKVNITSNSTNTLTADAGFSFLPYDEERYSLIRSNGVIEPLTSDKFVITSDGSQLQINGLGSNDTNSVLITTQEKINVSSKAKLKNRVNSIIIDKSSLSSSGIGTTTRNDNLTFGNYPFGTRVQDNEISLNVPDVIIVHGVFEAQNLQEPAAPEMTLANISPTNNTSSLLLGEKFIGETSGAVAICAGIIDNNEINFIYKNETSFQVGEVVRFNESNVTATVSEIDVTSKNITSSYLFDNGQRDNYYDYSRIIRKDDALEPQSKIKIYFDNLYYNTQDDGDLTTASSYSTFNYGSDIQAHNGIRNTDVIDIRPRVSDYTVSVGGRSPFEFDGRTFTQTGNSATNILASDENINLNFDYYQPRIDRIFLNKDGRFIIQKGVPDDEPSLPLIIDDSIEIAKVFLPAYLYDTSKASITAYEYKRYQMSDISRLETRIKNLEQYTTLSLLESETANLFVPDNTDAGLNRFKSGFFVDNFKTLLPQDSSVGIRNSVDPLNGGLRPSHYTNSIDLIVGTKELVGAGTTSNVDYSTITSDDILGENIQKTGDIVTLKYENVLWLDQPYATRVENVQPFILSYWEGTVKLNPSSDIWIDTVRINPKTIQVEGDYIDTVNRLAATNGVNPQTGIGPIIWGSWSLMGYGNPRWVGSATGITNGVPSVFQGQNLLGPARWTGSSTDAFAQGVVPTLGLYVQTLDAIYGRSGTQTIVTETFDTQSLGDSVVSVDIIPNMRSRNIEFKGVAFERGTRVYPFFDGIDVSSFCFPKLIEVAMFTGTFSIGERVRIYYYTGNSYLTQGYFRIAKPNHKAGRFDSPTEKYTVEPYRNTSLPESYSSTSTIVNVDTSSLALQGEGNYYGRIQNGYVLVGETSGAVAVVTNLRLIADNKGDVIGSFFIPNPNVPENPTFTAGTKTFRLTSHPQNNPIPGQPLSVGENKFFAEGKTQTIQEKIISIRNAKVVTNSFTDTKTEAQFTGLYIDPLAQSFACDEPTGIFLTKLDVYFESKDASIPVTCQIRTMELGTPTKTVLPFSEVSLNPEFVNISSDGSLATTFTFESPVYLEPNQEYSIVLLSNSTSYRVWISRLGERDSINGKVVETQPTLGSLFKSQNASTWSPSQFEDLKFRLYRAEFTTNPGYINFYNPDLSEGNSQVPILSNNPLDLISRRIRVGLATTITESDANFKFGQTVYQPSTEATGIYVSKVGLATGGTSNGGLTITSAGIGYTPSTGSFTYNNVALTSVTGTGRNATANITISNGVAVGATIATSGSGYQIGDVLTASQIGSTTLGRNLRISIADVTQFNEIILDNVQGNFATGVGVGNSLRYYNSSGTLTTLNNSTGGNVTITAPIQVENDGLNFRVRHLNHGMHSDLNYVTIKNVTPDTNPARLTVALSNTATTNVSVSDATLFANFEGYPVSINNPGYAIINNEIIKYTSVTTGSLNGITRAIDSTLAINHPVNTVVYKYELNGVSLLRINRTHRLEDATIVSPVGLDYYSLKINQAAETVGTKVISNRTGSGLYPALFFNTTKSSGGNLVRATQNMPYELITPLIETFIPNNTNVTAQVRTVSGQSVSGNEVAFVDKGYSSVTLREYNYFDSPRIIASKINETNLLSTLPGNKSFNLLATLTTNDSRLTPCIDLTRNSIITTSNRVNKIVADDAYAGDNRVNSLTRDQNAFIYVTNAYRLEIPATSIKLLVTADVNSYSDIRALYAIDTEENGNPIFELFPGYNNLDSLGNTVDFSLNDGTPDRFIQKNNTLSFEPQNYREYEFTSNNLPPFKYYRIKLILTSTNQAYVPKIKDIRSIALA
jgi:hypothetical protein